MRPRLAALLDAVVDIDDPDVEEDRRRLAAFKHMREAVPLHAGKAWVESRGGEHELPRPRLRRIG